jgi:hypothetical protein
MNNRWDYERLFSDITAYNGKSKTLEEMNADKNLLENYLYEGGIVNEFDNPRKDLEAGYRAYVQRFMHVESLKPKEAQAKPLYGIPVEEELYNIVRYECEANAYFALKEMWLDLLEKEKELLKKEK